MKRKLLAFSMTLALMLSVLSIGNVAAHTIYFQGNPLEPGASRGDWWGTQPNTGQGAVMRNQAQQGEFIFNDPTGEQRLVSRPPSDTEAITREADLDWFGVTADASNVYFLAKVDRYTGIANQKSIELIITVDTDHKSASGNAQLPLNNGAFQQLNVPSSAAWEFAIDTTFTPGTSGTKVQTGSTKVWTSPTTSSACATCNSQLASAGISQGSFVEISVPWGSIKPAAEQAPPQPGAEKYLRFTVSTMYNDRTIPTLNGDTYNSPVIDVLGTGSGSGATLADISDGQMDNTDAFDVHFDTNPVGTSATYEPYAPLEVTEFQPNPVGGTDTPGPTNPQKDSEWIEIYNPNSFAITNLNDYKIGNAAQRSQAGSSTQGMFKFKDTLSTARKTIGPKATIIVAKYRDRFLAGHPTIPAAQVYGLDIAGDFSQETAWSNGAAITLDNGPSATATTFEEQVVLLDGQDDIVDLVNYGNSTPPTPGNIPIVTVAVPEGVSFERCPAGIDTNGGFDKLNPAANNTDFVINETVAAQTPAVACPGRPGVDMQLVKTANVASGASGDSIVFTLSYSNIGKNNDPAGTAQIVDTLPAELLYQSSSSGGVALNPAVSGQTVTWNVTAPPAGGAVSTIEVTAKINAGVPPNTPMVNTATITSPNEQTNVQVPGIRDNNTSQATVTTVGPALLAPAFSFSGLGGKTPPNSTFQFTLNYGNTGQDDATETSISLDIPANVRILSVDAGGATPNFGTPIDGAQKLTFSVGNLASGATGAITLNAQVLPTAKDGDTLPFTANIQGISGESTQVVGNAEGSQTVAFNKIALPLVIR